MLPKEFVPQQSSFFASIWKATQSSILKLKAMHCNHETNQGHLGL